jgi:xylose isomerase
MRHFDAHAYRTEDYEGVKDFARGCMRTYLILKEKAERWNTNEEIRSILAEIEASNVSTRFENAADLLAIEFDRKQLSEKGLKYERLDQLTIDVLFGVD